MVVYVVIEPAVHFGVDGVYDPFELVASCDKSQPITWPDLWCQDPLSDYVRATTIANIEREQLETRHVTDWRLDQELSIPDWPCV